MNIRTLVSLTLTALVAGLPLASRAERITDLAGVESDANFVGYLFGNETKQALRDFAARWDRNLGQPCGEPYTVDMLQTRVTLLQPIDTPTAGKPPVEGMWQFQFTAERCAKAKTFNVMALARRDNDPLYIGLVPGMTQADPNLIRDTLGQLEMSIKADVKAHHSKTCKDFMAIDTQVVTPPATKGALGAALLRRRTHGAPVLQPQGRRRRHELRHHDVCRGRSAQAAKNGQVSWEMMGK